MDPDDVLLLEEEEQTFEPDRDEFDSDGLLSEDENKDYYDDEDIVENSDEEDEAEEKARGQTIPETMTLPVCEIVESSCPAEREELNQRLKYAILTLVIET